ncbi:MAG: hypothetical protein KDA63_08175 [Planctomycetales bacterium]|nr:hypothetical protein [Planctomycetales bacterium]
MIALARLLAVIGVGLAAMTSTAAEPSVAGHPRLYVTADQLPTLRRLKTQPSHAAIWANLVESADWCAAQTPRREWIPTRDDDPRYENLYDRFYAAMHDMAIVEHLAFASALSNPADDTYFAPARGWALATARVWRNEASNKPDASKAYAVLRVMKALAVSYDLLYDRLEEDERGEIRDALTDVCRAYFVFFQDETTAGAGYNKHHGSVDAAPFGVVALALLSDVQEAQAWLDLMVEKHTEYLLPHALTPSGTSEQSSNFWASTLQYRIFFLDALRRVTGRDLVAEFPDALPGRMALAAIAGPQPSELRYNEAHRSVLFGPSYGQIDYWSPVLVYLAREQRRPIFQYLAGWDGALGRLQRTRYITPTAHEELLFSFGGYVYVWLDPTVPSDIEPTAPLSFEFPEPEVNEAYLRASYEPEDMVVGFKKGGLVVHAGGRPVLVDQLASRDDVNDPAEAVAEMLVADDGCTALIRCVGPESAGIGEQRIRLRRAEPDVVAGVLIDRETDGAMSFWYAGPATHVSNALCWPDGTELVVSCGSIAGIEKDGFIDKKSHYAGMEYADPHAFTYPLVTVVPQDGRVTIEVTRAR